MEMEERKSGLITPKPEPLPPSVARGPLEITEDADRERAKDALVELWHASGLYEACGLLQTEDRAVRAAREAAWQLLSSVLLGDDGLCCERLT